MFLAFWFTPSVQHWQIINEELYVGLLASLRKEPQQWEGCMLCLMEVDATAAQEIDLTIITPHPALKALDHQYYDGPHS